MWIGGYARFVVEFPVKAVTVSQIKENLSPEWLTIQAGFVANIGASSMVMLSGDEIKQAGAAEFSGRTGLSEKSGDSTESM